MNISTYECGSCALAGIRYLSDGNTNAEDAMLTFCRQELLGGSSYGGRHQVRFVTLAPIYVFVAGPEVKVGEPGSSHHSKDHWPRYGTEFAAFITGNGLGQVVTNPPRLNIKYHPSTTCQAWLWCPDQKALEAWYMTKLAEPKEKADAKQPKIAEPAVAQGGGGL